jgi:putative flavoprotein involved in K+ transport
VCERVPAKRGEVEDESLRRKPCFLGCRRQRGDGVVDRTAEEFRDAASVCECLALNEADEVVVSPEEVEESADVRRDGLLGGAVPVAFGVAAGHRLSSSPDDASQDRVVQRLFAAKEVRGRASCDAAGIADLLDAGALEALAREEVFGGIQDHFSSAVAVPFGHAKTPHSLLNERSASCATLPSVSDIENPAPTSNGSAAFESASTRFDVVVIGAGQAGLVMGYFLARQGRRFTILEARGSVGSAWRERWESLILFTPRRYDALPGLAFPGDPDGYPTRDEVIAYLEQYAETFELPVEVNSPVRSVTRRDNAFVVELPDREIEADQVVVATGPFQAPNMPTLAGQLAPEVFQTHSAGYRRPSDVPEGQVVVVGGGNTGFQIAKELSETNTVKLAIGSRQTPLPQRLLGRDLFWWLTKFGLLNKTVDSRIGRRAQHRDTLIGSSPRELKRRYGVELKPRVVGASGRTLSFADGSELEVDAVIWATGYRPDHSWIEAPLMDSDGSVRHRRGVTDVPGLYFLGLSWQYTRGSALLGWVKDDAEFIAEQIAEGGESALAEDGADQVEDIRASHAAGAREEI